jgi:hypothetical protein
MVQMGLMKASISFSFADAYGLGLIASNTAGVDRNEIVRHLGPEAERIGREIISTESSSATRAKKKLSKPGKKARAATP